MLSNPKSRTVIVLITLAVPLLVLFALGEISQDQTYHDFADNRIVLSLPNFFDVISNLLFALVGVAGTIFSIREREPEASYSWPTFFAGLMLVGFGSAYYHLNPNDSTLVWDRLPMALSFAGLTIALLSENISPRIERLAIVPAILVGLASVVYWHFTGDLRLYIWVQILPLLTILLILLLFRDRHSHSRYLIVALLAYLLAKIAEFGDEQVFRITAEQVSGHTLKHLLAGSGAGSLYLWIRKRKWRF